MSIYSHAKAWRAIAGLFLCLAFIAPSFTGALAATTDHSKFEALKGPFATGPDVTKACLSCHTEAAKQVHTSIHWTWDFTNPKTGQKLGKKNVINNFCVALDSNEPRCTSCHAGYGWKDAKFDFKSEANVDCLVCHEQTGTYKKFPVDAGHPNYVEKQMPPGKVWPVANLAKAAQSVGPQPTRQNCGACHFFGGGGDSVKHGDIDSTLGKPSRDLDVHMGGLNFSCATCHQTKAHQTVGSRYDMRGMFDAKAGDAPASCESCHTQTPHKTGLNAKLINEHTAKLACATCHVPEFARDKTTKMHWDWSTAGKLKDGKPFVVKNAKGDVTYDSMKGDFIWSDKVEPSYRWFNGDIKYTLRTDKIDETKLVPINTLGGSASDGKSRIWPFKVMTGKQPYDAVHKTLLIPHLFGGDPEAYWKSYDWNRALAAGMKSAGLPFSGQFGWVETEYSWPITHMVAPKEKALKCVGCHVPEGRLKDVPGLKVPCFTC